MTSRAIIRRGTTSVLRRAIGAGMAALLLLAQVAGAADRCPVEGHAVGHEPSTVLAGDHHDGMPDAHCAVDRLADVQAPGTEPKRDALDPGPVLALAARPDTPPRVMGQALWLAGPRTGPPRTPQFRSLRL